MRLAQNGIEGTPEEVKDFIKNSGFEFDKYLKMPKEIGNIWIIVPICLYCIILISFIFLKDIINEKIKSVIFLFTFVIGTWLVVNIQLKFKTGVITFIVCLACILILLISYSYIIPKDILKVVTDLK